jgi:hypothetical protein
MTTRKEKVFQNSGKLQRQFKDGTLNLANLNRLPEDKKHEYLQRELRKKYNSPELVYSCTRCACTALFDDNGYITDDELIIYTGLPHK